MAIISGVNPTTVEAVGPKALDLSTLDTGLEAKQKYATERKNELAATRNALQMKLRDNAEDYQVYNKAMQELDAKYNKVLDDANSDYGNINVGAFQSLALDTANSTPIRQLAAAKKYADLQMDKKATLGEKYLNLGDDMNSLSLFQEDGSATDFASRYRVDSRLDIATKMKTWMQESKANILESTNAKSIDGFIQTYKRTNENNKSQMMGLITNSVDSFGKTPEGNQYLSIKVKEFRDINPNGTQAEAEKYAYDSLFQQLWGYNLFYLYDKTTYAEDMKPLPPPPTPDGGGKKGGRKAGGEDAPDAIAEMRPETQTVEGITYKSGIDPGNLHNIIMDPSITYHNDGGYSATSTIDNMNTFHGAYSYSLATPKLGIWNQNSTGHAGTIGTLSAPELGAYQSGGKKDPKFWQDKASVALAPSDMANYQMFNHGGVLQDGKVVYQDLHAIMKSNSPFKEKAITYAEDLILNGIKNGQGNTGFKATYLEQSYAKAYAEYTGLGIDSDEVRKVMSSRASEPDLKSTLRMVYDSKEDRMVPKVDPVLYSMSAMLDKEIASTSDPRILNIKKKEKENVDALITRAEKYIEPGGLGYAATQATGNKLKALKAQAEEALQLSEYFKNAHELTPVDLVLTSDRAELDALGKRVSTDSQIYKDRVAAMNLKVDREASSAMLKSLIGNGADAIYISSILNAPEFKNNSALALEIERYEADVYNLMTGASSIYQYAGLDKQKFKELYNGKTIKEALFLATKNKYPLLYNASVKLTGTQQNPTDVLGTPNIPTIFPVYFANKYGGIRYKDGTWEQGYANSAKIVNDPDKDIYYDNWGWNNTSVSLDDIRPDAVAELNGDVVAHKKNVNDKYITALQSNKNLSVKAVNYYKSLTEAGQYREENRTVHAIKGTTGEAKDERTYMLEALNIELTNKGAEDVDLFAVHFGPKGGKTSLKINAQEIFDVAQAEAERTGKTVSEVLKNPENTIYKGIAMDHTMNPGPDYSGFVALYTVTMGGKSWDIEKPLSVMEMSSRGEPNYRYLIYGIDNLDAVYAKEAASTWAASGNSKFSLKSKSGNGSNTTFHVAPADMKISAIDDSGQVNEVTVKKGEYFTIGNGDEEYFYDGSNKIYGRAFKSVKECFTFHHENRSVGANYNEVTQIARTIRAAEVAKSEAERLSILKQGGLWDGTGPAPSMDQVRKIFIEKAKANPFLGKQGDGEYSTGK